MSTITSYTHSTSLSAVDLAVLLFEDQAMEYSMAHGITFEAAEIALVGVASNAIGGL